MGFFQKFFGGSGAQGGKMAELLQSLTTDLNLDAGQASKVSQAFSAFKEQRKAIKSAGGDKGQIQAARQQMTNQLMALLNDQQKQVFSANAAKYEGLLQGSQE